MHSKHKVLISLLCASMLALSSCAGNSMPITESEPLYTLPPAFISYVPPIGDAALEYDKPATLYLPRHDGTRLAAVTSKVSFSPGRPSAESLLRALLSYPGDGVVSSIGGSVKLSMYGVSPVEVSRDVATVNLSGSALQLSRKALYNVCQAITNTITELPEISYVNVLVADKPVGIDVSNTLPMGTFSRSVGTDINAVYEQLFSNRVQPDEEASDKRLSANATLYFPIAKTGGMVSEVRTCSFSSMATADMVVSLLQELALGPQQDIDSPALPLLADLLTIAPTINHSEAAGGEIISLTFAHNLDGMLTGYGLTRAQSMASMCYTLCTFFPSVAGIKVQIGSSAIESITPADGSELEMTFDHGIQQRSNFATMLYDYCTLYFANSTFSKLTKTMRPIAYYQQHNPRTLLVELAKGPMSYDSVADLTAVMPSGKLQDSDILGLSISGNTLIANFSALFQDIGTDMTAEQERFLAYAIVNTLCADEQIKNVCIFVNNKQFDGFTGEIYWRGLFFPMLN